ncbi:MAG TPA: hypothetical protein DDY73_13795, partial [Coprobacter fastidiosus]|nr:hypothetical protein [Coprobacter fastidiosus]
MIYIVLHKQSLFDIALQLYGSIAGVFALAATNNIQDITVDLQPGVSLEYNVGDVVDKPIR